MEKCYYKSYQTNSESDMCSLELNSIALKKAGIPYEIKAYFTGGTIFLKVNKGDAANVFMSSGSGRIRVVDVLGFKEIL